MGRFERRTEPTSNGRLGPMSSPLRPHHAQSAEAPAPRPIGLDDTDLSAFIAEHGVAAELCYPGVPTPTVPDAARALGVEPDAIIKSLVFETQGAPCLVIAAGEVRIAYKMLADALSVSRRQLRLVAPEAALEITGFPVGAMPPFGHHQPLPTFVDSRSVPRGATVYGGGGTRNALLRVEVDTLLRVTAAQYLPLTATT